MKKFFNVPYDDEVETDLYMKIMQFNTMMDNLTDEFNLSEDSKNILIQMYLDGMSLESIKSRAELLKSEKRAIPDNKMSDKDFYERISNKYHVDIETAKMICNLLKLGIPMDTIMTETAKIKPPKMKKIEIPERDTNGIDL